MRHLIQVLFSIILGLTFLITSCGKIGKRDTISRFKNQFATNIKIEYAGSNTRIQVVFHDSKEPFYYGCCESPQPLKLNKDSYIKVNGIDMELSEYGGYQLDLDGKPICTFEFRDLDGSIYKNVLVPPDTAYFINFPDSVLATEDFVFEVNPALIDSNETNIIALDDHYYGDQHFWNYFGTDSKITIKRGFLDEPLHMLFFGRSKSLSNPNFPKGGGEINYNYNVIQYFNTK